MLFIQNIHEKICICSKITYAIKLEPSPTAIHEQARISCWNIFSCARYQLFGILGSHPFASVHAFLKTKLSLEISQIITLKLNPAQAFVNQFVLGNTPIIIKILKKLDYIRTISP